MFKNLTLKEDIGELFSIGMPILIEQFAIVFRSMFVSILISRVSASSVAAVNLVETMNNLFQNIFLSLAIGCTVVVAQYNGKSRPDLAAKTASQAVATSFLVAVASTVLLLLFNEQVLGLILGGSEMAVRSAGHTYYMFSIAAFPLISIYSVCTAAIRGSGYPRISLAATIITNTMFTVLCATFILGFDMGVEGAGLAYLIAYAVGAGMGIYLLKRGTPTLPIKNIIPKKFLWEQQKPLLTIGIPCCIENVIFIGGRLATQTFVIPMGTAAMAANSIGNNMAGLLGLPGSSLTLAVVPIIGRHIGAGEIAKVRQMCKSFFVIAYIVAIFSSITMHFVSPSIVALYTDDEHIRSIVLYLSNSYYLVSAFIWATSFITPSILRSAGDAKYTTLVAISSMLLMRVTTGYFLCFHTGLGVMGVWVAMYLDWVVRGTFFVGRLVGKKWLNKALV